MRPNPKISSPEIKSVSSDKSETTANKLIVWVQYFDICVSPKLWYIPHYGQRADGQGWGWCVGRWPDDGHSESGKEEELKIGIGKLVTGSEGEPFLPLPLSI